MSPLHIACLRGDNVELIEKLLNHGANPHAKDDQGRTVLDLMSLNFDEMREIICKIAGQNQYEFSEKNSYRNYSETESEVATVPSREERQENIIMIGKLLQDRYGIRFSSANDDVMPQQTRSAAVFFQSAPNFIDEMINANVFTREAASAFDQSLRTRLSDYRVHNIIMCQDRNINEKIGVFTQIRNLSEGEFQSLLSIFDTYDFVGAMCVQNTIDVNGALSLNA